MPKGVFWGFLTTEELTQPLWAGDDLSEREQIEKFEAHIPQDQSSDSTYQFSGFYETQKHGPLYTEDEFPFALQTIIFSGL